LFMVLTIGTEHLVPLVDFELLGGASCMLRCHRVWVHRVEVGMVA
jgi:hypothetical protein